MAGKQLKRRIYLVSPRNPDNFWTMQSSVRAVGARTLMPNNALATLAALTPKELDIEYIYCDENIAKINFNMKCDMVAITGYVLHSARIKELSDNFRKNDIPVAIGGPYATLYPDDVRRYADYLFVGEGELTWPQFLHDWFAGNQKSEYRQVEHINMESSPAPDWSFVNGKHYLYFTVQTSRGCPNNCDFCDAIRLVGRKYRTKSIDQIMLEINNAYKAGAETIFFSEDNFFVKKSFTKELLKRIIAWNVSLPAPVSFSAQATIRIGDDEEILQLLADARFSVIFLGVESIRRECLEEINKSHLFQYNPVEAVKSLSRYGILPFIGLIVGFDNDDANTFHELEGFLNDTASPIASISVLNAPENTRLYHRMQQQNRLNENFKGIWHFSTNIIPISMTLKELLTRHRNLFKRLYDPELFEKRALNWLANIQYFSPLYANKKTRISKLLKIFYILRFYIFNEPTDVRKMFFRMLKKTWKLNPKLFKKAITILSQYCHYYDFSTNAAWHKASDDNR